jgi:hypothetical protein
VPVQRIIADLVRFCIEGTPAQIRRREAAQRGEHLLIENLSPSQRDQLRATGYFEVRGGTSGHRYRIRKGWQMNVDQLDEKGRRTACLCFSPEGLIVTGDVMLAQKLALELLEPESLKIANTRRIDLG